ncbi:hypothetical protein [Actinosynnema sp. NPDC020468]|uniref:hypothetical protein n=1 Tax=Actinosynnema sp. NPDC020468 TaxID=3154488 RepID=UPI0033C0B907
MRSALVLAAAAALTATVVVTPAASASVRITELPPLTGHTSASVTGVNDAGQAVGTSRPNLGVGHAVLWNGTTGTDLGTGSGVALNRNGRVLISESTYGNGQYLQHPRTWDNGVVTDIAPGRNAYIIASAISGSGVVPMTYSSSPYGYHQDYAGVWQDGAFSGTSVPVAGPHLTHSVVTDSGVTAGYKVPMFGTDSYAFRCSGGSCVRLAGIQGSGRYNVSAANESGVVVGNLVDGSNSQPLLWEDDSVTVLPGGQGAVATNAQAINERGDVVGWRAGTGGHVATLWRDGAVVDLGASGTSEAVAVNDLGAVIGWQTVGGQQRAFVWRAGVLTDLGTLPGDTASIPVAINNSGTVVGHSIPSGYNYRPVKWTVRG